MRAIQITRFGGPEVLDLAELPDPTPGDGLELIEVDTAGVNYADTHATEDTYLSKQKLPMVPGAEVVGRDASGRPVATSCQLVRPAGCRPPSTGRCSTVTATSGTVMPLRSRTQSTLVVMGTSAGRAGMIVCPNFAPHG